MRQYLFEVKGLIQSNWLLLFHCVWLFVTPQTVARQAPLSTGFPRQEYWSALPFPSPGDLPNPGIEPEFPALAGKFFTIEPPRKPRASDTSFLKTHAPINIFITWVNLWWLMKHSYVILSAGLINIKNTQIGHNNYSFFFFCNFTRNAYEYHKKRWNSQDDSKSSIKYPSN